MKYELPGSSPATFIDLLNDADVGNMWEAWREHCMMQASAGVWCLCVRVCVWVCVHVSMHACDCAFACVHVGA